MNNSLRKIEVTVLEIVNAGWSMKTQAQRNAFRALEEKSPELFVYGSAPHGRALSEAGKTLLATYTKK